MRLRFNSLALDSAVLDTKFDEPLLEEDMATAPFVELLLVVVVGLTRNLRILCEKNWG